MKLGIDQAFVTIGRSSIKRDRSNGCEWQGVMRQRPGTAKGIMFLSLKDELGRLDLVVKLDMHPVVRPAMKEPMLIAVGGRYRKVIMI